MLNGGECLTSLQQCSQHILKPYPTRQLKLKLDTTQVQLVARSMFLSSSNHKISFAIIHGIVNSSHYMMTSHGWLTQKIYSLVITSSGDKCRLNSLNIGYRQLKDFIHEIAAIPKAMTR